MVPIRLKSIVDEVFQDYKKPSMMLVACECNWKCLIEEGLDISLCQNSDLANQKIINISYNSIIDRYINNPITQAIIIGGLEPMLQLNDLVGFIRKFRKICNDDIVIYTGYNLEEISPEVELLKQFENITIKFGRYKINRPKRYDDVLGIWLMSDNQYAIKIS